MRRTSDIFGRRYEKDGEFGLCETSLFFMEVCPGSSYWRACAYVGCFAEGLNFLLGGIHVHAYMEAKLLQHLKNSGQFLFGKHTDLAKVEVRAAFGLPGHPALTGSARRSSRTRFRKRTTSARTPKGNGSEWA